MVVQRCGRHRGGRRWCRRGRGIGWGGRAHGWRCRGRHRLHLRFRRRGHRLHRWAGGLLRRRSRGGRGWRRCLCQGRRGRGRCCLGRDRRGGLGGCGQHLEREGDRRRRRSQGLVGNAEQQQKNGTVQEHCGQQRERADTAGLPGPGQPDGTTRYRPPCDRGGRVEISGGGPHRCWRTCSTRHRRARRVVPGRSRPGTIEQPARLRTSRVGRRARRWPPRGGPGAGLALDAADHASLRHPTHSHPAVGAPSCAPAL